MITEYINPGNDWTLRPSDRRIADHVSGDAVVKLTNGLYVAQQTYTDQHGSQSWREIGRFRRCSTAIEALDNAR